MKTTDELKKVLENSDDLEKYLSDNYDDINNITFTEYIEKCLTDKGISKSNVIEQSNIQKNYAYQIFDGSKNPSRDKVLALAFSMELDIPETNRLLKLSNNSILYPRIKRDSIISFAINQSSNLMDTNILLDEMGERIIE